MASILVTGARGFIGQHLVRFLVSRGHRIAGLGHGIWPGENSAAVGLELWINGDIEGGNLRLLQQTFGAPDVVFHLGGGSSVGAAIANPREDFIRTVAGTVELLEWMRLDAPRGRLIAVSSAAVYGAAHPGRIAEGALLEPYSPYGHHKRMMEDLCRSFAATYGTRVAIARLFSVYGSGLQKQLLWDLCSRLAAGANPMPLGGTGREVRDWTDVGDVVSALAVLMDAPSPSVPVFNVGTGRATSVREIAEMVLKCWANSQERVRLQFSGQSRSGDPFALIADPSRMAELGFECRIPIETGLLEYVKWFRSARAAS